MPVQECEAEGKPGYQWGESGKCYTYPLGNEEARKEAKREAYIQGYAMGELNEMETQDWIPVETELATIVDVPIIHAGTFYPHNSELPFEVSEEDLDDIVEGSTLLQPVIQEAIHTGIYRGNEETSKRLTKSIPGQLNIKHQQPFASQELSTNFNDWIKEAVQGVTVSFQKKMIDGKNWVVKRFHHVRDDVAQTLQQQFPFRSSEFIPLKDPNTGKLYSKVERSTAFLDVLTPPAVPGQSPELVVEFAGTEEEPLTTIITTTGVNNIMAEKTQEKSANVSELQKMQDTLTAQTQALAELQARVDKAEADRAKAEEEKVKAKKEVTELQAVQAKVAELQVQNEELLSDKLVGQLIRVRTIGNEPFRITPAYREIIEPIIRKNGMIELAEGQSYRQAMTKIFDEIAELASKDAILLPLSTQGERSYKHDEQPKDFDDEVHELMEAENLEIGAAIERVTTKHQNNKKEN